MKVNVSLMRDYLKCPQLAHNLHVLKRGPATKPMALEVGTLFHEAMDQRLKGAQPAKWSLKSFADVSEDTRAAWNKHKLWLPVDAFAPEPGWEIIGSEMALEKEDLGVTLQGRLDAIIKYNDKFWSLQWKTYDGNDLLGLCERVRLSYHEVAYQWLAEQNGYAPWGGTILGACAKLPGYRLVGGKRQEIGDGDRAAALTMHFLTRAPQTQAAMWTQTLLHLNQADLAVSTGLWTGGTTFVMQRNYDQCFGPFGRGRCPFFSVCHEGGSLDDPQFTDLEDRYAV
jgi:hypothetical protein